MKRIALVGAAIAAFAVATPAQAQDQILNASYDIARELFRRRQCRLRAGIRSRDGVPRSRSISRMAARRGRRVPSPRASRPTS
jgi:ABC-type sulfate transport system substrate-binding protein